jgi:hypothetical protein
VLTPGATGACPADFNRDGVTNPDDLSDVITCFFTPGCACADVDRSGAINPDDLSTAITTFFLAIQSGQGGC